MKIYKIKHTPNGEPGVLIAGEPHNFKRKVLKDTDFSADADTVVKFLTFQGPIAPDETPADGEGGG